MHRKTCLASYAQRIKVGRVAGWLTRRKRQNGIMRKRSPERYAPRIFEETNCFLFQRFMDFWLLPCFHGSSLLSPFVSSTYNFAFILNFYCRIFTFVMLWLKKLKRVIGVVHVTAASKALGVWCYEGTVQHVLTGLGHLISRPVFASLSSLLFSYLQLRHPYWVVARKVWLEATVLQFLQSCCNC
jgi:hypothetical protein